MKHKTRGIAIHRINYSDTSLIIQILTRDFGMKSYMVKGITGKKSGTKKALFLPLNLLELDVSHSGKEKIEMIYEARNQPVFSSIYENIYKSCIAQFTAELLLKSVKQEDVNEAMYSFIESSILWLDHAENDYASFHLSFALTLTKHIGFYPSEPEEGKPYFDLADGIFTSKPSPLNPCADPRDASLLIRLMREGDTIKLDRDSKKTLLSLLLKYYTLHVPAFREMNSLKVLEEVLA